MASFKKFEDIEAWKLAREIAKEVFLFSDTGKFSKDFGLKDQSRRSSGSMMDNIAEGFERDGKNEFIQFLSYGKGSSGELKSQLYRAMDCGYINVEEFEIMYEKTANYGKMVGGLMNYLKATPIKGEKFKNRTP